MASEKQIEANRLNAKKSTGPRTDTGKEASRMNALKHGMRAVALDILPNEDAQEYRLRVEAWLLDCPPRNVFEEQLVLYAASLSWKLDRAKRYEQAHLSKRINAAIEDYRQAGNKNVEEAAALAMFDPSMEGERLRRYQASLHREIIRTVDTLAKLQRSAPGALVLDFPSVPTLTDGTAESWTIGIPSAGENLIEGMNGAEKVYVSANEAISSTSGSGDPETDGDRPDVPVAEMVGDCPDFPRGEPLAEATDDARKMGLSPSVESANAEVVGDCPDFPSLKPLAEVAGESWKMGLSPSVESANEAISPASNKPKPLSRAAKAGLARRRPDLLAPDRPIGGIALTPWFRISCQKS